MAARVPPSTSGLLAVALALAACGSPRTVTTPAAPEAAAPSAGAAGPALPGSLVIYSGRSESLVDPVIRQFADATGIDVQVRYGSTPEMAATLLEEGSRSPADVFFAQDPGGLGAVAEAGLLASLPEDILSMVPPAYASADGQWVGVSGRVRVVVYNIEAVDPTDLPDSLDGFSDPSWKGRLGMVPANGSFQTMVTAMRRAWGEEATREWLVAMLANDPISYENNTAAVAAVGAGEVDAAFVNHYYLYRFLAEEGDSFPARNHYLADGGPGSLVMVAGAGRLVAGDNEANALRFLRFLLSTVAQQYFASTTYEYPLVAGVTVERGLPPLDQLQAPQLALEELADIEGSLALLQEVGFLP